MNAEPANETDLTKCICGVYEPDLAMLFCDSCNSWSHTVCCGFFTNNDKRLPQGPYNCLTCQYRDNSATLKFLQSLAIFRRALYIIYHEGINTTGEFADRIGISIKYVRVVMRRLIQENFLEKIPVDESTLSLKKTGKFKYNVLRNPEIKKMLKLYFSSDLTIFQGFKYCIRNPNAEKCVGSFRLARNIQGISRRNESNLSEEQDEPEKEQNPKKKVKVSIVEPGIKCQ